MPEHMLAIIAMQDQLPLVQMDVCCAQQCALLQHIEQIEHHSCPFGLPPIRLGGEQFDRVQTREAIIGRRKLEVSSIGPLDRITLCDARKRNEQALRAIAVQLGHQQAEVAIHNTFLFFQREILFANGQHKMRRDAPNFQKPEVDGILGWRKGHKPRKVILSLQSLPCKPSPLAHAARCRHSHLRPSF